MFVIAINYTSEGGSLLAGIGCIIECLQLRICKYGVYKLDVSMYGIIVCVTKSSGFTDIMLGGISSFPPKNRQNLTRNRLLKQPPPVTPVSNARIDARSEIT